VRGAGGRFLLYLAFAVGGALFGLIVSRFFFPAILESRTFFVALVFSLLVLGLVLLAQTLRLLGGPQ
jgi:hypothetical protein